MTTATAPATQQLSGFEPTAVDLESFSKATGQDSVAAGTLTLRPDLNGLLVKQPNSVNIYLIDLGYRRWIPNPTVLRALFGPTPTIYSSLAVAGITPGIPVNAQAVLLTAAGDPTIYLLDSAPTQSTVGKRWIANMAIYGAYHFASATSIPPLALQTLPSGPNIAPPQPA